MTVPAAVRRLAGPTLIASLLGCATGGPAPTATTSPHAAADTSFGDYVRAVMARPEYRHSLFGLAIRDVATDSVIYALNGDVLMTPASTTKLFTEGTALALLGADRRFHTRVYRTGPVQDGVLRGDLVLVAAGDPNLSNRIRQDSLAFQDHDHAYGGPPVEGDPLVPLRDLAKRVAAAGIRRVGGAVRVDASLFPSGEHEGGTGIVISPIVVNDNIVDGTAIPAAAPGGPVSLHLSPDVGYVHVVNRLRTGPADSKASVRVTGDSARADGSRVVTVAGTLPAGGEERHLPYGVPDPVRFAAMAFAAVLRDAGVDADVAPDTGDAAPRGSPASRAADRLVAEHVSPPLAAELMVTLKVSQNLHASMTPYLLGALLAQAGDSAEQTGFDLERGFLEGMGLDLDAAQQSDGAGADAHFAPELVTAYLDRMAARPDFDVFFRALPVLGRDGTLAEIQPEAAGAGHVHAKTGTYGVWDKLNRRLLLTAKGLAGYIDRPDGRRLAFAFYVNRVPIPADLDDGVTKLAGQMLGELADAAYRLRLR